MIYSGDEDYGDDITSGLDFRGMEPDQNDEVLCCPDCARPNQFGEQCRSCARDAELQEQEQW